VLVGQSRKKIEINRLHEQEAEIPKERCSDRWHLDLRSAVLVEGTRNCKLYADQQNISSLIILRPGFAPSTVDAGQKRDGTGPCQVVGRTPVEDRAVI
jgi:hypothetical protein